MNSSFDETVSTEVVMATHNGASFLREQMNSVLMQKGEPFCVLVGDDQSEDDTLDILTAYAFDHPSRVRILASSEVKGGAKGNFSRIVSQSTAPYIAFCDQDDVWHEDKLHSSLKEMQRLEALHPGKPVLVHSDLEVVDEQLNPIAASFFDYQRLPRQQASLLDQLVKNNVTGCTMLINRRALQIALPIPEDAIMHDWWIACRVLQSEGAIGFIDKPLVKYRQHNANTIGAHNRDVFHIIKKMINIFSVISAYRAIERQAAALGVKVSFYQFVFVKAKSLLLRK